jgi:uncharacterized delta-60 repeat protein
MKTLQKSAWSASAMALALAFTSSLGGCSDDDDDDVTPDAGGNTPDAAEITPDAADTTPDAADTTPDAADTAPDAADTTPDAGPDNVGVPIIVPISPTGTDAFFGVAFDPAGNFYAVGHTAPSVASTADRSIVLARFLPNGVLDESFGKGGVAITNVVEGGANGETARGIVIQSTGKIVVSGTVEHDITATPPATSDRDVALLRFDTDGTLDPTFGDEGIVILNLNDGVQITGGDGNPAWAGADAAWSLSVYPNDKLLVHAAQRATGFQQDGVTPRTDTDFAVVRLTADGGLDTTFGTNGKKTTDLGGVNASVRAASILPDGSIIGAGYANTPGLGSTQPVVYKLTPDGEMDTTFGSGGFFHEIVLQAAAEAYGVALQGDKLITIGYGRNSTSESLNWVSVRLNANGTRDNTWGTDGLLTIDVAGFADNGRNVMALPDGRTMMIGGGRLTSENGDGMVAIVGDVGQPDTLFDPSGYRIYDLGGTADFFWGGAVSPDHSKVALVGLRGFGNAGTETNNDDGAILILSAQP